jgi:dTDP-4-dehydrorhamnose 3,5-epimerase
MQTREAESIFVERSIPDVVIYPLKKFEDERGWLAELFRNDRIAAEFHPAMSYISFTRPGIKRGPHEHTAQADLFCFLGPSDFKLRLWDNRENSPTYRSMMTLFPGAGNAMGVIIPKGIVHAYQNIGPEDGMVINCPNRLYKGEDYSEEIDEIRHEDDPGTIFIID